ncbi:MAG: EamA family transporter [Clostridia bacterium]|nr:EamA family transporter [Clostridia bacterium]
MKAKMNPTLMLIVSMLVFGTLGLFVRHIALPSGELALYRAVMATVLLGGYLLITREGFHIGAVRKELPLLLLSGAAMGVNWILLFEAYRYTTISVATLSYYFAPVIVTILSPLLFREKMTAKGLVCFALSTVGLVLVIGVTELGTAHLTGILFGLGAAVLYATVILLNKTIKEVAGIQRTFWQFIAATVVLIPYVMCTGGFTVGSLGTTGWGMLAVVGIVHTGITYCLYFSSIKELSGHKIALLSYIDPLTAIVLSMTVLSELVTLWQLVGGAMILLFTLISEIPTKSPQR